MQQSAHNSIEMFKAIAAKLNSGRYLTKLFLLMASFTLLILMMYQSLEWNSWTVVWQQDLRRDSAYIVPASAIVKPKAPLFQHLENGIACGELQNKYPDSIPPLVHWTTKDGRVHKKLIDFVRSWLRLNQFTRNSPAKWYFMHWDDMQISQLIDKHYPMLRRSYANLTNGLERSDIGRLVVLHHVGGVYIDSDVELRQDLTPLLMPNYDTMSGEIQKSSNCRTALWSKEPLEHAEFLFNRRWLLSNAVMMSRAKHSFLTYVLNHWPIWYEAKLAAETDRETTDAVYVTGPLMLLKFYQRYLALAKTKRPDDWCDSMLAEPHVFQPIMDEGFISVLRTKCKMLEKLSEPKRELCRKVICDNFTNRPVPNDSFTVHHFMHLSYKKMDMNQSKCIHRILPILKCSI